MTGHVDDEPCADPYDGEFHDEDVAAAPRKRAVWTPLILGAVLACLGADLLFSGTIYLVRVQSHPMPDSDFGLRLAMVLVVGGSPAVLGACLSWIGWRRLQAQKVARAVAAQS